ncbi:CoA transferase [Rhodococcus olei]|uniref:CaiB/BaiF CoA transferase family protein n=1 Tax=Rhodococcus olei TaxID=2161675 RepID=UPI0031F118FA
MEGIRVADFTRILAGPHATMLLADLGADIVKFEETRVGDGTRRNPPIIEGESLYFQACNRGKKSVAVDLKSDRGRALALEVVEQSDIVIENFRPGVMDRLGLSYDVLKARRPGIIMCSISGYGQEGPMARKPSFDLVSQAVSGLLSLTGEPGRHPVRCGVAVGDLGVGTFSAVAVLAALHRRAVTGEGAWIDMSLHDCLLALMTQQGHQALAGAPQPSLTGSSVPGSVPSGAFEATDGWITLEARTDQQWIALAKALGPEALEWTSSCTNQDDRDAHADALQNVTRSAIATNSVDHWVRTLTSAGVPVAPVWSMDQVLDSTLARDRSMVVELEHPTLGQVRTIGSVVKANDQTWAAQEAAPLLGQHSHEVLREIVGLTDAEIENLKAEKVVR